MALRHGQGTKDTFAPQVGTGSCPGRHLPYLPRGCRIGGRAVSGAHRV